MISNTFKRIFKICCPFRLFKTTFTKLHDHYYTGIKITYNIFSQYYYILFLENGFLFLYMPVLNANATNILVNRLQYIFFLPSITEFQCTQKALSTHLHRKNTYIHVIVDAFSHFGVSLPIKLNNVKTAISSLLKHWINLVHSYTLSLSAGQKILTLIWHNFALSWEYVALLKHLTLLGQMD